MTDPTGTHSATLDDLNSQPKHNDPIRRLEDEADGDLGSRSAAALEYEEYDEDDARRMSPRRSAAEMEKMGVEAKAILEEQAKALQSGLLALLERVDKVKEEHDKLEAENRFLQEYIGSLMATSKITGGSGPASSGNRNSRSGTGRIK